MPVLQNARHERFAQELASGKTATDAYPLAGYKPDDGNASKLGARPDIQARVQEITGKAAARVEIDRAWVLRRLIENVDRAMQAAAVKNADGTVSGEYKYEGSVANKALELLGKEIGMFVDRKEVRTGKLDGLDDERLDALIGAVESIVASGAVDATEGRENETGAGKPH